MIDGLFWLDHSAFFHMFYFVIGAVMVSIVCEVISNWLLPQIDTGKSLYTSRDKFDMFAMLVTLVAAYFFFCFGFSSFGLAMPISLTSALEMVKFSVPSDYTVFGAVFVTAMYGYIMYFIQFISMLHGAMYLCRRNKEETPSGIVGASALMILLCAVILGSLPGKAVAEKSHQAAIFEQQQKKEVQEWRQQQETDRIAQATKIVGTISDKWECIRCTITQPDLIFSSIQYTDNGYFIRIKDHVIPLDEAAWRKLQINNDVRLLYDDNGVIQVDVIDPPISRMTDR